MAYSISGTYVAACTCSGVCPCPVDERPTHPEGICRGAILFDISEGNLDDLDISGVKFALYNYFPSNVTAGNWTVAITVDESASDEQASAVERIISGQEGGPFAEFGPLIGEYRGMDRAPISTDRTSSGSVGGIDFSLEPYVGVDGQPTTVKNAMFGFAAEYVIAKASGRGEILGESVDLKYGERANFVFSSTAPAEVRGRA